MSLSLAARNGHELAMTIEATNSDFNESTEAVAQYAAADVAVCPRRMNRLKTNKEDEESIVGN